MKIGHKNQRIMYYMKDTNSGQAHDLMIRGVQRPAIKVAHDIRGKTKAACSDLAREEASMWGVNSVI